MTATAAIGVDLARSLVLGLGADCPTAAALARAMEDRQGNVVDVYSLANWPTGSILRVTSDFVTRGWLSRLEAGWLVGPRQMPSASRHSLMAQPRCGQSCRMGAWRPL